MESPSVNAKVVELRRMMYRMEFEEQMALVSPHNSLAVMEETSAWLAELRHS